MVKLATSVGESWKAKVLWMNKALREMGLGRTSYFKETARQMISELHSKVVQELPKGGQVFEANSKSPLSPAVLLWRLLVGSATPEDDADCETFLAANEKWLDNGVHGDGLLLIAPFLKYVIPGITGYTLQMDLNNVTRRIAQVNMFWIKVFFLQKCHRYSNFNTNDLCRNGTIDCGSWKLTVLLHYFILIFWKRRKVDRGFLVSIFWLSLLKLFTSVDLQKRRFIYFLQNKILI